MINNADNVWVLISTAMVILMTPALAFFYGGMVRKKNMLSTLMLSVVVVALISVMWVLFGYSIAFGPDHKGLIGGLDWFGLKGVGDSPSSYAPTIPHLTFMAFQMAFAIITPALITGAFVERVNFSSVVVFLLAWTTFVYAPVCHWVWADGGWLRAAGVMDFAGGIVVHLTAGVSALAVAIVVGRRKGHKKYAMDPSNIPFTVLGAFLLWFGWFGFNAGSALTSGALATKAFVNTNTAGATAALVWMLISWIHRRPSVLGFATGAVCGLAAVTPASGFITPMASMAIGAVAAAASYYAITVRMRSDIDDSLDVFPCHGIGGIIGTLAVGIFASKAVNPAGVDGLLYGNAGQLYAQAMAVAVVAVYSYAVTFILSKVIDALFGLRAKDSEEEIGLDISQHGETAYSI